MSRSSREYARVRRLQCQVQVRWSRRMNGMTMGLSERMRLQDVEDGWCLEECDRVAEISRVSRVEDNPGLEAHVERARLVEALGTKKRRRDGGCL